MINEELLTKLLEFHKWNPYNLPWESVPIHALRVREELDSRTWWSGNGERWKEESRPNISVFIIHISGPSCKNRENNGYL